MPKDVLPLLVYVEWVDARGCGEGWSMIDILDMTPLSPCHVVSTGFVLREDKEMLHIAPHYVLDGKDSQFCGDMQIPIIAIKKRVEIPLPEEL